MELVAFTTAGKEYAVDIMKVREVIRAREPTAIPTTEKFMAGVICIRNEVIPLIDLNTKLGADKAPLTTTSRIIISHDNERPTGFIVDGHTEIISLETKDISQSGDISSCTEYLIGIGKKDGRLIMILDIEMLLSEKEKENINAVHQQVEIKKRS